MQRMFRKRRGACYEQGCGAPDAWGGQQCWGRLREARHHRRSRTWPFLIHCRTRARTLLRRQPSLFTSSAHQKIPSSLSSLVTNHHVHCLRCCSYAEQLWTLFLFWCAQANCCCCRSLEITLNLWYNIGSYEYRRHPVTCFYLISTVRCNILNRWRKGRGKQTILSMFTKINRSTQWQS